MLIVAHFNSYVKLDGMDLEVSPRQPTTNNQQPTTNNHRIKFDTSGNIEL